MADRFTLPSDLAPVALQNQRLVYGTLLQASAQSLLQLARDPHHLGADIGFLAVLHTWGQNLHLHPHVHCVVPGGGISLEGNRWVSCRPGFFLPVRPLGRLFHGLMANRVRAENLVRCRVLLGLGQASGAGTAAPPPEPLQSNPTDAGMRPRCPVCGEGHLRIVGKVEPVRAGRAEAEVVGVEAADTS